jgi:protein-S-isoprenylcysteine O-methyltransferase Ste14
MSVLQRQTYSQMSLSARRVVALVYGATCHAFFAVAIVTMITVMGSGMTWGQGAVPTPYSWLVNVGLLAQFTFGHSVLLSKRGRTLLQRLAPCPISADMAPTTYLIVASIQLFLLFLAWTPSGVVWWQATGALLQGSLVLFVLSWILLMISVINAGISLQSGFNGWSAVFLGRRTSYPDMPTSGVFRFTRNPIYVSFALATWMVPVWTPDQLLVATSLTAYCLIGPLFKEARMSRLYGERFLAYTRNVPYWLPGLPPGRPHRLASQAPRNHTTGGRINHQSYDDARLRSSSQDGHDDLTHNQEITRDAP